MTNTTDIPVEPFREEADQAIRGLEELIQFYNDNPEAAVQFGRATIYAFSYSEDAWKNLNQKMGKFEKNSTDYDLEATRKFGPVTLKHCIGHDKVCEKKVTGTRTTVVSKPVEEVEYHDVEVTEDIVEWVCPESWMR
jgi:hypothetical protein